MSSATNRQAPQNKATVLRISTPGAVVGNARARTFAKAAIRDLRSARYDMTIATPATTEPASLLNEDRKCRCTYSTP